MVYPACLIAEQSLALKADDDMLGASVHLTSCSMDAQASPDVAPGVAMGRMGAVSTQPWYFCSADCNTSSPDEGHALFSFLFRYLSL